MWAGCQGHEGRTLRVPPPCQRHKEGGPLPSRGSGWIQEASRRGQGRWPRRRNWGFVLKAGRSDWGLEVREPHD